MADSKKYDGSTWEHSLRKLTTTTEAVESPLYSDGTSITAYTIKGNTVQNGTPTPDSPVMPKGCGDLEATGEHAGQYKIPISSGGVTTNIYLGSTASIRNVKKAVFSGGDSEGWYLQSINSYGIANFALNSAISPLKWIDTQRLLWVCNRFLPQSSIIADTNTEGIMLNQYNVCFVRINSSTVSTTAAFKTWLRNNPIVVYYVLANAETAAVNEPLMKIGDYADTISNAASIPTTEGANSITVDTTVQPSEFTATWTGWHDSSVKEWDGSDWG